MYLLKIARTKLKAAHWSYDATNWMSVLSMGFCLLFYSSLLFACNWIYFWPFVCYFRAQFHKGQKSVKQNPVCGYVESGNGPCTEIKTKTKNIETHIESTCRCWIWDISIETITELQPLNNITIDAFAFNHSYCPIRMCHVQLSNENVECEKTNVECKNVNSYVQWNLNQSSKRLRRQNESIKSQSRALDYRPDLHLSFE